MLRINCIMRKNVLSLVAMFFTFGTTLADNEIVKITIPGISNYLPVDQIESMYYTDGGATLVIQPVGGALPVAISCAGGLDMLMTSVSDCPDHLLVNYDNATATVRNPYLLQGVTATVDGAYVTVNNDNTNEEFTTELSGTTVNGAFTYYGTYKTTIQLSGLNITSQHGAAIDIECGKRVDLLLKRDTENTLVDCAGGEQKAALYCKGHLEIDKAGILNVTGRTAHAIAAKEYLKLKKSDGVINILGAVKDGIHCKQYFLGNGFSLNIDNVGDDCIQAELDGEANDDNIKDGTLIINNGTYTLRNSANGTTEGTDIHTAKGLTADGDMQLNAGVISIAMSGSGGKGIRVEGSYTQGATDGSGPLLTVVTTGNSYGSSSSGNTGGGGGGRPGGGGWPGGGPGGGASSGSGAKAIKVVGPAIVYGGTTVVTTAKSGAEGLESKTSVTIKGGNHYFRCYDDGINSSGKIDFQGGNTVCYSNGNDAVDSNYGRSGAITISGGNVFAYTSKASPEEGLDCDNNSYITITGGIAISAGGSQGGGGGWGGSSSSQSVGSSTQGYYLGSSPSSYGTSYYYTLCNTSGEAICTYKFEANVSNSLSLLTAPNLGKGSVTVKYSTTAPTAADSTVLTDTGKEVFFITPIVTTSGTTATVTAR